jgi:hypothetical protein
VTSDGKGLYLAYELRFGAAYQWHDADTNMYKEGQFPTYGGEQFDILSACAERVASWRTSRELAHPDLSGLSTFWEYTDYRESFNWWQNGTRVRGMVDRTFLHADGSVNALRLQPDDARLRPVPYLPHQPLGFDTGFLPPM